MDVPYPPRVVLYPEDLKPFVVGSDKNVYKLYAQIKERFNIPKNIRVTIFNVRDFYSMTIEEVIWIIFKLR